MDPKEIMPPKAPHLFHNSSLIPAPKGRGASGNVANRFEKSFQEISDIEIENGPSIKTQYFEDHSQSILSENSSPDIGFQFSINPYRGCEHGCSYCYARPTHEYLGFSSGLDFEQKIMVKRKAPELLRQALNAKKWEPCVLAMSGVTDCYQPIENKLQITRGCLEVLCEFRNPVAIITKNYGVTRDLDLLKELARYQAVKVFLSITSLDSELAHNLEPRAASPQFRLQALRELSNAGIPCGVLVAPVIPGLNDHEIPQILEKASEAGAQNAAYTVLRLPYSVKDIFIDWLRRHHPLRADKVIRRILEVRKGKLNSTEFGKRMQGEGFWAEQIANLFKVYRKKYNLENQTILSVEHFRRGNSPQLNLF